VDARRVITLNQLLALIELGPLVALPLLALAFVVVSLRERRIGRHPAKTLMPSSRVSRPCVIFGRPCPHQRASHGDLAEAVAGERFSKKPARAEAATK
jgi:hypothetical protein